MGRWVCVGQLDDFPEGRGRAVDVDGVTVGVFRQDGHYFALKDACPHMGASLADGKLLPGRVTCHWHGWTFDLRTGQADQRSWACAQSYEIRVRNDVVEVRVPDASTPPVEDEEEWEVWDDDKHLKRSSDDN